MYPPVLEHLEHEGRSASSRARADQQQVPGSVCCVVLTTVVEDCRLWTLPGSREKKRNGAISMLGSDLLRARQKSARGIDAKPVTGELASLILRWYDGTHPQHKLVSLPSSLIDRPEELTWSSVPCSYYSCRGDP